MADSADQGVVNHFGQVFKNETGTSCYDDLYVLDGAILPGPVGINPFLTIAAIALRNSIEIQRKIKDGVYTFDSSTARAPLNRLPVESYGKPTKDQLNITQLDEKPIKLKLYEQLAAYPAPIPGFEDDYEKFIGKLNEINKKQYLTNLFDKDRYYRLVIKLEAVIENLDCFLEKPDQYRINGTASLCLDTSESIAKTDYQPRATSVSDDFGSNPLFITPIVAEHLIPIARGTCDIGLLVRDSPSGLNKLTRWWETAKFAKKHRREDFETKTIRHALQRTLAHGKTA